MSLAYRIHSFLQKLDTFDYRLESIDRIWEVLFPNQALGWEFLHITQYQTTFFISHITGESGTLVIEPDKDVKVRESGGFSEARPFWPEEELANEWDQLISACMHWLEVVEKDWINAYEQVVAKYPFDYRFGTIPHSLIWELLPDSYRLDRDLGMAKTAAFVQLIEEGKLGEFNKPSVPKMTANTYFEYCKIAYLAVSDNLKGDEALSGRELYTRYADGRHEGLLDIEPDSESEFADWLDGKHPLKTGGGHPWEIKRGGNTTHIDLRVQRPSGYQQDSFLIELFGHSSSRLVETIKMFLAIYEASLPISIAYPIKIRKRLLGQDNIGIIPNYNSLHRANQHFLEEDDVFDVMYFEDIKEHEEKIVPFIRWEALPMLKP